MKNVQLQLNFDSDSITFMGDKTSLTTTSNSLYYLPLIETKWLLNKISTVNNHDQITLYLSESKTCIEIAQKLHQSFAHTLTF